MTPSHDPPSGRLVRRVPERTMLQAAVARAEAGEPSVTIVVGEPGIGKTALAYEFARAARRRDITVLRGAADETDRSTLSLWRGPLVALGVGVPEADLVGGDTRWEVLGTIVDALDAAAPIAVVLDDMHRADDLSVWIVDQLGGALAHGVAVVVTTRTIDRRRTRPRAGHVIAVEGLSVEDVAALADATGESCVDVGSLQKRTGGNPLFVLEVLTADHDGGGIPAAIELALGHTLDRLTPDVQRSLSVFALGGVHAPPTVIADAAGVSVADLRRHFDDGVEAGILVEPSLATVHFRHALFAETLVS